MKLNPDDSNTKSNVPEVTPQRKRTYRKSQRAKTEVATGEAILDAALIAFGQQPFDRVTLQSIAADSGATVQTVIRRFGSKEGLFQSLVERERPRILASRDVAEGAGMQVGLEKLLNHYEQDGDMILNFVAQERRIEQVRAVVEEGRLVHRKWIEHHHGDLLADVTGAERDRLLHAAIVATDLSTWKLLRRDLGLPRDEVFAIMNQILAALKGDK